MDGSTLTKDPMMNAPDFPDPFLDIAISDSCFPLLLVLMMQGMVFAWMGKGLFQFSPDSLLIPLLSSKEILKSSSHHFLLVLSNGEM